MPTSWGVAVDCASVIGLFVSIAGLVYSVKAWRQAKAAQEAAEAAREAVRRGNAAEELRQLADLAGELLACVQNNQIEGAALRGKDLLSGVSSVRMRWRIYFPSPEVERSLSEIEKTIKSISMALTKRGGQISAAERERLLNFCHDTLRILNVEAGRMAAHADSSSSGR